MFLCSFFFLSSLGSIAGYVQMQIILSYITLHGGNVFSRCLSLKLPVKKEFEKELIILANPRQKFCSLCAVSKAFPLWPVVNSDFHLFLSDEAAASKA